MVDEHGLPEALAADLEGHFEDVVVCYQDRLFGFAWRLLGSSRDAEEVTQDAFVRAYHALQSYPSERRQALQLRAWLYQIALNVVRNRVRRQRLSEVPLDADVASGLSAPSLDEQPEEVVVRDERRGALARALAALPERYGAAVVLRHVHDLSYAEAADILGQPVGTVKSDVHRGLRLLRDALGARSAEFAGGGIGDAQRAS